MYGRNILYIDNSYKFDVHRAVHRNIVSVVKPTRRTYVPILFYFI